MMHRPKHRAKYPSKHRAKYPAKYSAFSRIRHGLTTRDWPRAWRDCMAASGALQRL